jgi:hypothetical protein
MGANPLGQNLAALSPLAGQAIAPAQPAKKGELGETHYPLWALLGIGLLLGLLLVGIGVLLHLALS